MSMTLRFLPAAILAVTAHTADAASVDWRDGLSVSVDAGIENPLILFGFNPQPEPPAVNSDNQLDPTRATRRLLGIEPTPFSVYVAFDGVAASTFDPVEAAGVPGLVGFDGNLVTDRGQDLRAELRFTRNGTATLLEIDALFFNPQPEPPALWDTGSFGFEVRVPGLLRGDSVGATLQVLDFEGDILPVSAGPPPPIPLPPAIALLGLSLLGLGAVASLRARRDRV